MLVNHFGTMEVTFEQAVSMLQSMFTAIDREVVAAVLESNGTPLSCASAPHHPAARRRIPRFGLRADCHLEMSIEQLLALDPAGGAGSSGGCVFVHQLRCVARVCAAGPAAPRPRLRGCCDFRTRRVTAAVVAPPP